MIKLIVGIGNIGFKYIDTRHNFGHKYVQLLAKKYKINLKLNPILSGYIGSFKKFGVTVRLFIPNSYINHSGLSISKCVRLYRLSIEEILVAHDDLDLPPGIIKIKLGKRINESHHGIQSIIDHLDNNFHFYRLRIGIGRPKNKDEVIKFVLDKPSIYEGNKIDYIINRILIYTEDIIYNNFNNVMNKLYIY